MLEKNITTTVKRAVTRRKKGDRSPKPQAMAPEQISPPHSIHPRYEVGNQFESDDDFGIIS